MRITRLLVLVGLLALVVVPSAMAFRFSDHTRNTPSGAVGQPYSHAIETVAGCKGVTVEVLSGSLPPGLRLVGDERNDVDGSNWRIEGTPTHAGNFGFWLQARNDCADNESCEGNGDCTQEPFAIGIGAGLTIENPTLPNATSGQPYSTKLTASGGGNQSWTVPSGALPPGLALAADGTLSGTVPATTPKGDFVFTARVSDGSRFANRSYTLAVRVPLAITPLPLLKPAALGKPFTLPPLVATGGSESYTWSVAPETPLPAGITLDPATKSLVGTPTTAGRFLVKLVVTDSETRTASVDVPLVFASPLAITTTTLRGTTAGKPWTARIRTTGGFGEKTWKLLSVRPIAALRFDKVTGTLSWTPRIGRTYTIKLRVTDESKTVATQTLTLNVKPRPQPKKKKTSTT
jgi:hypothetical protein